MIDVTMTAVRRPKTLEKTLKSFREKMWDGGGWDLQLIINVDPVGEDMPSIELVDLCREYFPRVVFRIPNTPSFPSAFRWCWSQSQAPFVFHLEDDWELQHKVDFKKMLTTMENNSDLMILRLPFTPCVGTFNKCWSHFLPWNGQFFEVPERDKGLLGFCGHPSLIRRRFVQVGLKMLDGQHNPEKQLKWRSHLGYGKELDGYRYGVYGVPGQEISVVDIGRGWKERHGWQKKGARAVFTVWEKIPV